MGTYQDICREYNCNTNYEISFNTEEEAKEYCMINNDEIDTLTIIDYKSLSIEGFEKIKNDPDVTFIDQFEGKDGYTWYKILYKEKEYEICV